MTAEPPLAARRPDRPVRIEIPEGCAIRDTSFTIPQTRSVVFSSTCSRWSPSSNQTCSKCGRATARRSRVPRASSAVASRSSHLVKRRLSSFIAPARRTLMWLRSTFPQCRPHSPNGRTAERPNVRTWRFAGDSHRLNMCHRMPALLSRSQLPRRASSVGLRQPRQPEGLGAPAMTAPVARRKAYVTDISRRRLTL